MNNSIHDVDFKDLRERVERWAEKEHDDLDDDERNAPYTDGNFDSFNGWHRTVDADREKLLDLLGKAKGARTAGKPTRAQNLLDRVLPTIATPEEILGVEPEPMPVPPHPINFVELPFILFFSSFTIPIRFAIFIVRNLKNPKRILSLWRFSQKGNYETLRMATAQWAGRNMRTHESDIERRLDQIGYETDSIGLSEALGAKAIDEDEDRFIALIDQAERMEKNDRKGAAWKLCREVEQEICI